MASSLPPNANNQVIIWQTDRTPALSPLSCLLKGKTCGLVSCFRESENTHPPRYTAESGMLWLSVSLSFPLYRIPSLHIATWGRGKWHDPSLPSPDGPSLPPSLPQHPLEKNQSVFRSCHSNASPLTRDLWPQQGSPQRAWQGFVRAASVCSMSDANWVLVLRREGWRRRRTAWPCPPPTQ